MDVLDLVREHLDFNRREQLQQAAQNIQRPQSYTPGGEVIRRRADDSWF